MNKKTPGTKSKPLNYPDETTGSKWAADIRKKVSAMTPEQRAEHFRRGMVKIYGSQRPTETPHAGH